MSMSGGGTCYLPAPDARYGCAGQHTIAAHKEWLGWLDPTQVLTLTANSATEVLLNPLALPQGSGLLMIEAPIDASTRYYTAEAQQMNSYDKALDTEAVVIHEVDLSRTSQPA